MKLMKEFMKSGYVLFLTMAVSVSLTTTALAATTNINVQFVRMAPSFFMATTMDPSTGKFYTRVNFGGGNNGLLTVYDTAADYESDVSSGTVQLAGGGFWGTYFAARGGKIYGRASRFGSSVARWDAVTGTRELDVASIPNMGGTNFRHTFNWGGFSGVNWMQDGNNLILMGKNLSGSVWQVNRMDAALGIVQTVTINADSLGYGFVINGHLFTGDSYNSNHVGNQVNVGDGTQTAVDIDLLALIGSIYMSNTFFNPASDTLYLHSSGLIYKVTDAANKFGVVSDSDGDGVDDNDDLCPGTQEGDSVDAVGCSDAQVDADGDGECDPNTPSGGPSECAGMDMCDNTMIPESAPTTGGLNPNHWALTEDSCSTQ